MVFKRVWQRLSEWVLSSASGDAGREGATTEDVVGQAILDPGQTERLMAIEEARTRNRIQVMEADGIQKRKLITCIGCFVVVVVAIVFTAKQADRLELSWSPYITSGGTALVAGVLAAVVKRWWTRTLGRAARASAESSPGSRTEDDQNSVGAP
ncbi:hypothetical protein [Streptomyces griseoaurantiacus]|uniref:Uncharacterized protein n=1 Tax=Streptomyces griseoaurantiacus TaxID=68213 RepID=A0A7W2DRY0_9ACTN|nr:hypothetical protein [Streptomyces griseoaurantiacus]MBA5221915.1 hypothetical protein [Streptomyces griseoaurantiacus]